ncbi:MAG: hypothetical protein CMJ32_09990 [Phycisphaerae bacterium]|nr:hypothetical protein [Phycisphaerae bacterium]
MPASRSRTHEWKRSLQQIYDRGGALEIAIAKPEQVGDVEEGIESPELHAGTADLVWRVKILDLNETEITVEAPMTLGRNIAIEDGIQLVGAMTIGQNRWMFKTTNLGTTTAGSRNVTALRLAVPDGVRRCKRTHGRYDAQGLNFPKAQLWPLLDPKSVIPIERAMELAFQALCRGEAVDAATLETESTRPSIGPGFEATLMNIGGGGIGVQVTSDDAAALGRHRVFWVRFDLEPVMSVPLVATGKVVHTHIDSAQRTYAGIAFDFSFNSNHQDVIIDQIAMYIRLQQEQQHSG